MFQTFNITIKFLFIFFLFGIIKIYAQSLGTIDEPPRLFQLEGLLVQLIYVIWALSGLVFSALLGFLGFKHMISGGDQQKEEEVKKKGKNWLIGLILVFLSYPVVLTIYKVIGIGQTNSECYKDIQTPGFHFFFPTVCTDPQGSSTRYEIGSNVGDCSSIDPSYLGDSKYCSDGVIFPTNTWIGVLNNHTGFVISKFKCIGYNNGECTNWAPNAINPNCNGDDNECLKNENIDYIWDGTELQRVGNE